jgi:hypothetical protein
LCNIKKISHQEKKRIEALRKKKLTPARKKVEKKKSKEKKRMISFSRPICVFFINCLIELVFHNRDL